MKIESRVEALEHELKILKNEIQNTLLEIREQVLNHYYPELRADETPLPTSRPMPALKNGARANDIRGNDARGNELRNGKGGASGNNERKAQVQPFSDFFMEDDEQPALDDEESWPSQSRSASKRFPIRTIRDVAEDDFEQDEQDEAEGYDADEQESTPAPKLREVQYQQLKQAGAAPQPKHKLNQPLAQRPARRPFAALAAWVGDSVAKVGKERAVQVVETYAASGGNLADETKSSLLQLIALASDIEPAAPPSNQAMLGLMVELDHLLAE